MKPIEIRTATGYWIRIGILAVIFGGIGLGPLLMGLARLWSPHRPGMAAALLPLLVGLGLASIPALLVRGRRRWARSFDAEGVTRGDGRHLPWRALEGVHTVRRRFHGRVVDINHYELRFHGGDRAYVFPLMLANRAEVEAAIGGLGGQTTLRK